MPPELIIFDCDGVLIDSEAVASAVISKDLTALGWPLSTEQSMDIFLGMSIQDMQPIIETRLGRKLPDSWRAELATKIIQALGTDAKIIPGAKDVLEGINALGIPWRVASNSSDEEMTVKFKRTGLTALTAGRTHSASTVIAQGGRPKPAPDVFLAAANAANISPTNCIVIEDSALGVTGAVAAGMICYGFSPHNDGAHLTAAGASKILKNLDDLFGQLA